MSEQIAANKRKTLVLLLGFGVPLFLVGAVIVSLLIGPIGIAIVLVLVIGAVAAVYYSSEKAPLTLSNAKPADAQQQARLYNLVEGLCIGSGLEMPQLYIIEDDAPNAFSSGLNPKRAAIAVTTGLLAKMNRVELEGVLAHELSHIRNHDIVPTTLAVSMARVLMFAPLVAYVTNYAVSPDREIDADASGAQLTRYPPGLISALEKLQHDPAEIHSASKATAHLWIEQPLDNSHPPLDDRIRALQAM